MSKSYIFEVRDPVTVGRPGSISVVPAAGDHRFLTAREVEYGDIFHRVVRTVSANGKFGVENFPCRQGEKWGRNLNFPSLVKLPASCSCVEIHDHNLRDAIT